MAEYPFVSSPIQASQVAVLHLNNLILAAVQSALLAQIKTATPGPLTIDIVALGAAINADVQQLATDTQQPTTHPVTGVVVQPGIKSAGT